MPASIKAAWGDLQRAIEPAALRYRRSIWHVMQTYSHTISARDSNTHSSLCYLEAWLYLTSLTPVMASESSLTELILQVMLLFFKCGMNNLVYFPFQLAVIIIEEIFLLLPHPFPTLLCFWSSEKDTEAQSATHSLVFTAFRKCWCIRQVGKANPSKCYSELIYSCR